MMPNKLLIALAISATLSLAGCAQQDPAAAEAQAAEAAEAAAAPALADFEKAVADENWRLAKAQGDVLLSRYPGTAAAEKVSAAMPEVSAQADAAANTARLQGLWLYDRIPAPGGEQVSASIYGKEPVDTDGSGARRVRLIFRDHPEWGRSSYLVLERGDFDCYNRCRLPVSVNDGAAQNLPGLRPDTDEAIAMFIEDYRGLWRRFTREDVETVSITFPVKAGGTRTVVFEPGGLDAQRMPEAWNR